MALPTLFFFSLALLLAGSTASWISVPLPSGSWVAVREASRGRRFLLHPQALVERAIVANCSSASPSLVTVRFWRPRDLRLTERALREQQVCDPADPCRVEPFQARWVSVSDQLGVWRPLRPRRFVPVTLPPVMQLALRNATNTSCSSTSARDLTGLIIEMRGADGHVTVETDWSRLTHRNETKGNARKQQASDEEAERQRGEIARLQALLASREKRRRKFRKAPVRNGVTVISDCLEVKLRGLPANVYFLKPLGRNVRCSSAGELVVLKRTSGALNVTRNWQEYKQGFGDVTRSDFFLGLEAMRTITKRGDICMALTLQPMNKSIPFRTATYSRFVIGPESNRYVLSFSKFKGDLTTDALKYHRGAKFSTFDRDSKYKCVKTFKCSNWHYHCHTMNLFGIYNYSTPREEAGFSSRGLSSSIPSEGYLLRSALMTLRKAGGDPQALSSLFAVTSPSCPARVLQWTVPETAEYKLTAAGGAGGRSLHVNSASGGRGALVTMRVFLKAGSKLRFVVGCGGGSGHLSGGGGDGTFVAEFGSRALLLAAGGGGGAGW